MAVVKLLVAMAVVMLLVAMVVVMLLVAMAVVMLLVTMAVLNDSTSVTEVKAMDERGEITRLTSRAPLKDTVTIPDGGYTIIRFRADNPGMGVIIQVGSKSEFPKVPKNFPKCGSWVHDENNDDNGDDDVNNDNNNIVRMYYDCYYYNVYHHGGGKHKVDVDDDSGSSEDDGYPGAVDDGAVGSRRDNCEKNEGYNADSDDVIKKTMLPIWIR
ncbi:multicopper oxidase [Plakobranchus ocellatus]|uniref:Multicopper oxidase n=1 Tax=Plakobranchus ocellatus TaxID=259542 RepID=A0AAV3YND1_9GAST|nr:multicopper oxidase [Plakobranchus ocellatus]